MKTFLWSIISELPFLPLWYQTLCSLCSFDTDTEKWKLIDEVFGRFDVSAFSWRSPSAFPTVEKGLIKERTSGKEWSLIEFDWIPRKFLSPCIDIVQEQTYKRESKFFCWLSKLILWSLAAFCQQRKLGKNSTILGKNLKSWATLPPGQGPQIRNDISPPCISLLFKKREEWIFLPKISGFLPVFSLFLMDI